MNKIPDYSDPLTLTCNVCVAGDSVRDEGVWLEPAGGSRPRQEEALLYPTQQGLLAATHHLRGHPGRQVGI